MNGAAAAAAAAVVAVVVVVVVVVAAAWGRHLLCRPHTHTHTHTEINTTHTQTLLYADVDGKEAEKKFINRRQTTRRHVNGRFEKRSNN